MILNLIYFLIGVGLFISIIQLILSTRNKNRYICKWYIFLEISYIIMFILEIILTHKLYLPIGFDFLFIEFAALIGGMINIISLIINFTKKGDAKKYGYDNSKKSVMTISLLLVLIPLILITSFIICTQIMINNSELIVIYRSSGNGGIGDSKYFAVAIGDDYCKEFDLGIESGGIYLKNFISKDYNQVLEYEQLNGYEISFTKDIGFSNDLYFRLIKDEKSFCSINVNRYYNNSFERAFLIKK